MTVDQCSDSDVWHVLIQGDANRLLTKLLCIAAILLFPWKWNGILFVLIFCDNLFQLTDSASKYSGMETINRPQQTTPTHLELMFNARPMYLGQTLSPKLKNDTGVVSQSRTVEGQSSAEGLTRPLLSSPSLLLNLKHGQVASPVSPNLEISARSLYLGHESSPRFRGLMTSVDSSGRPPLFQGQIVSPNFEMVQHQMLSLKETNHLASPNIDALTRPLCGSSKEIMTPSPQKVAALLEAGRFLQ